MRFLSGIQPSGNITLGNYLGALKNFVKLQDNPEFTDFLVTIHKEDGNTNSSWVCRPSLV